MASAVTSSRALIRLGGLAAITAGVLRIVGAFLPADPASTGLAVLYLVTDVGIVLGLIGWYFAQHAWLGAWGTAGFVLGIVGVEIIRSSGAIPGVALYPPGALLLIVGIDVLAVRAWQRGQLPVWLPGLVVCSAITGPVGYLVPGLSALFVLSGLTFGIGFGGVGMVLWRGKAELERDCTPGPAATNEPGPR